MNDLMIIYRALNLYTHHAHNMIKGEDFHQDHGFFAELYDFADSAYDSIIERDIGLNDASPSVYEICKYSCVVIEKLNDKWYKNSLMLLEETLKIIKEQNIEKSLGTQNLLQDQADKIEVFIYKIKRRMM